MVSSSSLLENTNSCLKHITQVAFYRESLDIILQDHKGSSTNIKKIRHRTRPDICSNWLAYVLMMSGRTITALSLMYYTSNLIYLHIPVCTKNLCVSRGRSARGGDDFRQVIAVVAIAYRTAYVILDTDSILIKKNTVRQGNSRGGRKVDQSTRCASAPLLTLLVEKKRRMAIPGYVRARAFGGRKPLKSE